MPFQKQSSHLLLERKERRKPRKRARAFATNCCNTHKNGPGVDLESKKIGHGHGHGLGFENQFFSLNVYTSTKSELGLMYPFKGGGRKANT